MARVVVTGGAGFLGSHLCEHLLARDDHVVCVDNLVTGDPANIAKFADDPRFTFLHHDITEPFDIAAPVDAVLNFASPASPPDYLDLPIETLKVGSIGTMHALDLARTHRARFLTASTSEVYGDPHVHPQTEAYWGNVNPVGPRSVYDEAKRFGEALTMAYHRTYGVDTRLARIFNTYGPQMRAGDGRVVSNFIVQALRGEPITIYGDGSQTRSFCYVDDEIRGFLALLDADDMYESSFVAASMEALRSQRSARGVYTGYSFIDQKNHRAGSRRMYQVQRRSGDETQMFWFRRRMIYQTAVTAEGSFWNRW